MSLGGSDTSRDRIYADHTNITARVVEAQASRCMSSCSITILLPPISSDFFIPVVVLSIFII